MYVQPAFILVKGVDCYGTRGGTPPIFGPRNTITSVPPIFEESSQVIFICWFHCILFHQNAYFTLTKKLQLLRDYVPQPRKQIDATDSPT